MKKNAKRWLAMLLCLTMALSLLPMTALAAAAEDQSQDVQTQDIADEGISPQASTILPDGAETDEWKLDPQTARGTTTDLCTVTDDGHLHLKINSSYTNNGDAWTGSSQTTGGPAVFISEKMNQALQAENGVYTVSFKMKPLVDGMCFGVYFNYKNPANGAFIGYNTSNGSGSWFWQKYGGGNAYGDCLSSAPSSLAANTTYAVIASWNPTAKTATLSIDGKDVMKDWDYSAVADASGIGVINNIGIKLGKSNAGVLSEIEVWDIHYSGQEEITSYTISGTVKDANGAAVGGVAVASADGKYTATSGDDGAYELTVPAGTYNLTASKAGYANGTKEVVVAGADMTKQDITITLLPKVSGTVTSGGKPFQGATVTLTGTGDDAKAQTTATNAEGKYEFIGVTAGAYTLSVSAVACTTVTKEFTVAAADVEVEAIALVADMTGIQMLEGDGMNVLVDEDFPRVIQYQLKDGLGTMDGQTTEINTIKINGTTATLGTITSQLSADKKTVTYTIPMTAPVAATMTARLTVDTSKDDMKLNDPSSESAGRTLGFFIDKVEYTNNDRLTNPVKNIEIPNHFLVSVNSTQPGAQATGAKMGNNSVTTNDVTYLAEENKTMNWSGTYFAAFVSNSSLSASITSNSSINGGGAASQTAPNEIRFVSDGTNCTIGLSSIAWPYDYLLADSNPRGEDHTANLTAAQKVVAEDRRETPFAKVVIAPEQNGDDTVNWQDGAIALRETVMHVPANSDQVRDQVSTRIALNFGSQAQNPFLTSLDNAKRVAANTDGLGQMIVLKGYANEGHDSGHPDYWDMGTRMGGPRDFATMLAEGKKIGAYFGIHINASEMYAEAKAMEEDFIRYRGLDNTIVNWGWHWHDTAIKLRALYDLGTGNRAERFRRLANEGGGELSLIYVDVWGNASGGTEDSWQTRMLSNEITQMENKGWRIAHEWSYANPYESTWQHWATDYSYGGYSDKGQLNSAVLRFLLNQYKDSFPPDFATFGGACNAPLLGGPAMQGFEGWQGDGEYDLSIYNIYNQMIATKFLQHFAVTNWTNADAAVNIPYSTGANGAHNMSQTAEWTPEMQVKLEGKIRDTDAETAKIVVTRGLDETLDTTAVFNSLDDEATYRSRVITLNDKVILKGAPASAGEDTAFPASKATLEYLIPWYWTADGKTVDANKEKLYYWNGNQKATNSTEWELPDGWENLSTVILYELSDQGRDAGTTVSVSGGKVTFANIKPETGYVVLKGEDGPAAPAIEYTAPGQHVTDPSFNDASLSAWTIEGSGMAFKFDSINGISVMKQVGDVSVSQTLTEMEPNTKYVAYVAVENKSDGQAYIEVTDSRGNELGSNYTDRSIARNYISGDSLHNGHGIEAGGSLLQNMYVFFTTPATGGVTLTLGRTAGDGNVYFDALRVLETEMEGYTYDDETGEVTGLFQDFEHSAQGEWPFVVGGVENVADNRQHLSEKNAPYTQSGWNIKEVDDVIDGNWSLKTHGIAGGQSLVYQTIPQNFRFEPGQTYTVSFDYQMGCENLMQVVIGDGAWTGVGDCQTIPLEMAKGTGFEGYPAGTMTISNSNGSKQVSYDAIPAGTGSKTCTFTVVGSESGQTWFGIATAGGSLQFYDSELGDWFPHNEGMPDRDGYGLYFSGRGDFILDNLRITRSEVDKSELSKLAATGSAMELESYTKADGYEGTEVEAWAAFEAALTAAQEVLADLEATQEQVNTAKTNLETAMGNLKKVEVVISGTVTGVNEAPVAGVTVTLEDENYRPVGLTATTDSDGAFEFRSTEDVDLSVAAYQLRVQATGYLVTTKAATAVTKTSPTSETTIAMTSEAPGAYVNDFNDGDVSMMGPLVEESDETPTIEAVNYNGSGALKVTFNATTGETRHVNNVVDKTAAAKISNGTVSFDITALTTGVRFGVTLRATAGDNRLCIGQQDAPDKWMGEYWNSNGNNWTTVTTAPLYVAPGATRRVRIEMDDRTFAVYIDGVEAYNLTMSNSVHTDAGYVGINMRNNAGSQFIMDNLRIVSRDTQAADVYTVAGAVKTGDTPLAGAAVSIWNGDDEMVTSTTTNASGLYVTQPLEPGTYTIKVTAPNYTEASKSITINNANITDEDFALTVDKSKLTELYNANKDKDLSTYTSESAQALTKALTDANAVIEKDGATADEIGAAHIALQEAVKGLTLKPTDFAELSALYNDARSRVASDYESGFDGLQTAITAAAAVLFNQDATQAEVDAQVTALGNAIKALVPKTVNSEALQTTYDAVKDMTNDDADPYTADSWADFDAARTAAKTILDAQTATQSEVDAALAALNAAHEALTKVSEAVASVTLDQSTAEITEAGTVTLNATVKPNTAVNKNVTWKSSDTRVATVSDGGVVTGVAPGTATITVSTVDGGHKATCVVTVKPITYTVTFDSQEGTAVLSQTVEKNAKATKPDDPTKTGSVFGGWYTNADCTGDAFDFNTRITGDITLYAKWTANYTVTFNSNGGSAVDPQPVSAGGKATKPDDPTRTGFVFGGWYSDEDLTAAYDFSTPVTADITLYAKWTEVPAGSFTVTFDSNGGSDVETLIVAEGGKATEPAAPTKTGHTFAGWYSDAGLTNAYDFETPVTANITLYAKWTPNAVESYTVTFESNGGSVVADQTVDKNGTADKPADPTKTGFTFAGWYSDEDLTTAYDFDTPVTADITLYAKWTPETPAVDKTELTNAIDAANAAKQDVVVKPDDATEDGVAKDVKFVTQAVMDALTSAITDAQAVVDKTDATQDEVDAAVETLNTAVETFTAAVKTGTNTDIVDKSVLENAIDDATAAKTGIEVIDGKTAAEVDKGVKFVTTDEMTALTDAIAAAQAIVDKAEATQTEVNEGLTALRAAITAFDAAIKTGTKETVLVNKDALNNAIDKATEAKDSVEVMENGATEADVDDGVKFVTQDVKDTLDAAIADAQAVADKTDATQGEVDAAVTALNDAVATFNSAVKTGTYTQPSIPSGGGSSSGSSSNTTVEKNPDGSTTTTVTDKKTGTVTETTEKPDGTKEIVETKKDGTVTETTEKTDGSKEVVETKPDGTVTETKTDAEGAKTEKVTDSDKNVAITVTDKDGEVLAKVELPAEIPAPETRFEDVPEGHWADEAIHNMAALEVVNGVGDNRFDMDSSMTRGALATVLSRLSNGQKGLEVSFTDVDADKWYADGIAWAAKTGVVTGYSESNFGPEDVITREQLAVMLCRYARLLGMDTTADSTGLDKFNDGSSTHDWAADSIAWCVNNGILNGMGNGNLAPTATATRAQVAVMLQRFMDLMK